ncbi:hypothetical protein H5410_012969 [Solanum commersonii]|uniref:Uncharacterized protein n=1 Tax=Solanum commersonii TaxID=4109 RepID=A0A9J6AUC4_SOLCO|nr:hypothetical protein H5410_012969 [Solanum commersonii]
MATMNNGNNSNTPATAAPPKQTQTTAKTVDMRSMSGDSGISAFPEEDNIFCWKGTITGSKDTVFEGNRIQALSFISC